MQINKCKLANAKYNDAKIMHKDNAQFKMRNVQMQISKCINAKYNDAKIMYKDNAIYCIKTSENIVLYFYS
jgi:hypothetical protein